MLRPYRELPRAVLLLSFGAFVNRAGTFVLPFLALYVGRVRGLGDGFATFALGVYGLGSLSASLVGGALADRIGRRPVMLSALFGAAGCVLLLSQLEHRFALLAGVFAFAFSADLYRPASSAMIADLVPAERRSVAYSLYYVAINLGFAVGASAGGQIAKRSFSWLFLGDAISLSLFGLLILAAIPESRRPAEPTREAPPGAGGWSTMLADRPFLAMLAAQFLCAMIFHQGGSTLPLYMSAHGLDPSIYGSVIALNGVLIVAVQLPVTPILAARRTSRVLALGAILVAVGFGATAFASDAAGYALTVLVWTAGEICLAGVSQAAVAVLAPVELRARYFGALSAAFGLGMAAGPPLGGLLLEHAGGNALWAASAVIATASALIFLSIGTRVDDARPVSTLPEQA